MSMQWRNNGYAGPNGGGGGSSFSWTSRGIRYSPIDRGEVMNFANMGGLGRADLIQVYPGTNEVRKSLMHFCCVVGWY